MRVCLCVFVVSFATIISTDRVADHIKSWCGHGQFLFKNGFGGLICGVFFNWIWQSKMLCFLHRLAGGGTEGQMQIHPTLLRSGLVRLFPQTYQTALHGGDDNHENFRLSATTANVD